MHTSFLLCTDQNSDSGFESQRTTTTTSTYKSKSYMHSSIYFRDNNRNCTEGRSDKGSSSEQSQSRSVTSSLLDYKVCSTHIKYWNLLATCGLWLV